MEQDPIRTHLHVERWVVFGGSWGSTLGLVYAQTHPVSIDPITRLEGHGKIDIFLDEEGNVANAYLLIPELRGFEKFAEGRPVEEMPRITPRICGVCPEAHHMASAKAWSLWEGRTANLRPHKEVVDFFAIPMWPWPWRASRPIIS